MSLNAGKSKIHINKGQATIIATKKAFKGKHQCNINTKDKQENHKGHKVENRTGTRTTTDIATKSQVSRQA